MHELRPLLCRPSLLPGESLPSWLLRLSAANGYDSPAILHNFILTGGKGTGYRQIERWSSPIEDVVWRVLTQLTRNTEATIYDSTAHRFLNLLVEPSDTLLRRKGLDGVERILMQPLAAKKYLRGEARSQFCPMCLQDSLYHKLIWLFNAVAACVAHSCLLVDRCPKCQGYISVRAIITAHCLRCGEDLRTAYVHSLAGDHWGLETQTILQKWLLCEELTEDINIGHPVQPLPILYRFLEGVHFSSLYSIRGWSYLHPVTGCDLSNLRPKEPNSALEPYQIYSLYATSFRSLYKWPIGFYEFLDAYRPQPQDYPQSIGGRLGVLYKKWLLKHWQDPKFDFVQEAFDTYFLTRYGNSKLVTRTVRYSRSSIFDHTPTVSTGMAASMLKISPSRVLKLVDAGLLSLVPAEHQSDRPRFLRSDVNALIDSAKKLVTQTEVVERLGTEHKYIVSLVRTGLLTREESFFTHSSYLAFREDVIVACLEAIKAHLLPNDSVAINKEEWDSWRRTAYLINIVHEDMVFVLQQVMSDQVACYYPGNDPIRLSGLYFAHNDVLALIQRVKVEHQWLSSQEVIYFLAISERLLSHLCKNNLLTPCVENGVTRFYKKSDVEKFRDNYITLTGASRLLNVSQTMLVSWTKSNGSANMGIVFKNPLIFERSVLIAWFEQQLLRKLGS